MKSVQENGFALILVIIILFMASILLLVVTSDARTLLFQADRLQVQAIEQNLYASGLAWMKQHGQDRLQASPESHREMPLPTEQLTDRHAVLTTIPSRDEQGRVGLALKIECSYGKQRRRHTYQHSF